jgi:serine/threonine-protein kinase
VILEHERVAHALPGYDVGEELGRGAWGVVLRGEHRGLRRPVAIKQLPRALAADPAVQRRFAREAHLLAGLDHPHIVRVYDYVEQEDLRLLVMELLPGGTVRDRLEAGDLPAETACAIALATCVALDHAHGRGILHRDIKPENLLFGAPDQLKVSDFGIARVLGGGSETLASNTGLVLGSPAYIAPEQIQGREASPATDVYGVGMLLYKLLAGRLPFAEEGELMSVLYRRVHDQPRQLLEVAPHLPGPVAGVTMRTLAADPRDRIASAEELGAELADAAAAAWGPDWLRRSGLTVLASGRIADRLSAAGAGRGAGPRPEAVPAPAPNDVVPLRDALAGGGPPPAAPVRRRLDRRVWGALAAAALAVCVLGGLAAGVHHLPRPLPVAATKPSPSPSAATVPGALVWSDDFRNPGSGWAPDQGQTGAGTAEFAADGYHVVALQPQNALMTFSIASPYTGRLASMSAVAGGTLLAGAPADGWGVRCDQGGRAGLRYTFEIHGDGSWVIFRIDDRGSAALAQGVSQAVRTGPALNSVRGDCTELATGATQLTMWVNGAQVGQTTDDHPGLSLRWHAALVIYRSQSGPAAEVRFNRFREYDLGQRA